MRNILYLWYKSQTNIVFISYHGTACKVNAPCNCILTLIFFLIIYKTIFCLKCTMKWCDYENYEMVIIT